MGERGRVQLSERAEAKQSGRCGRHARRGGAALGWHSRYKRAWPKVSHFALRKRLAESGLFATLHAVVGQREVRGPHRVAATRNSRAACAARKNELIQVQERAHRGPDA